MSSFYQEDRWFHLKSKILDKPGYSYKIWNELKKHTFKKILDCGTGTGEFVKVLVENKIEFESLIGLDIDSELIDKAQKKLADLSKDHNIQFQVHDLYDEEAGMQFRDFDLVTGQALLEYTDLERIIPILKDFSKPGGYLYFPHTYMAPAIFQPVFDDAVDQRIVRNFDRYTIENQQCDGHISGDSRCGGKLFSVFNDFGFEVVHFETTDWMLYPGKKGYSEEEMEILEMLVSFFYQSNKIPNIPLSNRVNPKILEEWNVARLNQIHENKLVFICPQGSILVKNA